MHPLVFIRVEDLCFSTCSKEDAFQKYQLIISWFLEGTAELITFINASEGRKKLAAYVVVVGIPLVTGECYKRKEGQLCHLAFFLDFHMLCCVLTFLHPLPTELLCLLPPDMDPLPCLQTHRDGGSALVPRAQ